MDGGSWLREYQQQAAQRVEHAQEIQQQLASASGSASSGDGAVTVTVGVRCVAEP